MFSSKTDNIVEIIGRVAMVEGSIDQIVVVSDQVVNSISGHYFRGNKCRFYIRPLYGLDLTNQSQSACQSYGIMLL